MAMREIYSYNATLELRVEVGPNSTQLTRGRVGCYTLVYL